MKIRHVVTLLSETGAYGGPFRVALNQSQALIAAGHDVEIWAGWQNVGGAPKTLEGVPLRTFDLRRVPFLPRFSGLLPSKFKPLIRRGAKDIQVLHVHAGRDLASVTAMRTARRLGIPYVVQTHGMVMPDGRAVVKLADVLVIRKLLQGACARFVLTEDESKGLLQVLKSADKVTPIRNGVWHAPARREPSTTDVLYCSRFHPRKQPKVFVEMADILRDRGVSARFSMVGADDGELSPVLNLIAERGLSRQVHYEGSLPYQEVLERMRQATVYVLPSVNEPFPMTLLEALSLGIPSVCTDSCGLADTLLEHKAALVVGPTPESLAAAVEKILTSTACREELAIRARICAREEFSMESVVQDLERIYKEATSGDPSE